MIFKLFVALALMGIGLINWADAKIYRDNLGNREIIEKVKKNWSIFRPKENQDPQSPDDSEKKTDPDSSLADGDPKAQPTSPPKVELVGPPRPPADWRPPIDQEAAKVLKREFAQAQKNRLRSLAHLQKVELQELKNAQRVRLRSAKRGVKADKEKKNLEKKLEAEFKKEIEFLMASHGEQRKTLEESLESQGKKFGEYLSELRRPPESLWPERY